MLKRNIVLTLEEELQILQFWAHGMDIARRFSAETIASVAGLNHALEAAFKLPPAIGWGDEDRQPRLSKRSGRTSGKSNRSD